MDVECEKAGRVVERWSSALARRSVRKASSMPSIRMK